MVTGVLAGAATAFYAFLGFEDSVNLAEETDDPSRSFPPAMITGLVLAGVVYLLVAFTAAMTVPLDVLTESSGPLLEVVRPGRARPAGRPRSSPPSRSSRSPTPC